MAEISRAALFGKLSELGFRSIESGTVFCKLRGHAKVGLEHWLHQILQGPDSDLHRIVRHFDLDAAALARDLTDALDRLACRADGAIDLSVHVEEAVERGWIYASLMYGIAQVRTGHLMIGLLKTPTLRRVLIGISRQFERIDQDRLSDAFDSLLGQSPEANGAVVAQLATDTAPGLASGAIAPAALGRREALARFTVDLTSLAREGRLDAIVGRNEEIRQVIDILMRRRQNNPILTGEAGVGKTAVVEGLARRIVAEDVPPPLRGVSLCVLDVGLLQAGASMKGEFEQRLRQVIEEAQSAEHPVILFIDEAHTLVGAGGTAGTGDAANLLKPALARGTLRTIAATTWAEYKRHIEKDPALTRRFQPVPVTEPDEAKALAMLRALVPAMESHHGVAILDEALDAAVKLSHRYIADRQLPDKAVSLIDTVCARVAASRHATPPALEAARETIATLEAERVALEREAAWGNGRTARLAALDAQLATQRARAETVAVRWAVEKDKVDAILAMRRALHAHHAEPCAANADDTSAHRSQPSRDALVQLERELREQQGEAPLVAASVDRQAVASVVQDWTGIPVKRMVGNELDTLLALAEQLDARIVGQPQATRRIAQCVQTARAGLSRPGRPLGVFLLAGPSGVGKTETALALAEALYGGEQNLITFNMSEYQEPHTVSTLKGAPPGYVGYGEGGVLTEAVRRRPYSVVLLDEIEKAHRDVHEVFYQVFDKGWMEDGEGRVIDFRNTLILLTTNAGADEIAAACADATERPSVDALTPALREALVRVFAPPLLGRMTAIPYYPLSDGAIRAIVRRQLARVQSQMRAQHGIELAVDENVVGWIAARCDERESGARLADAVIAQTLLPEIGRALLARHRSGERIERVNVLADGERMHYAFA